MELSDNLKNFFKGLDSLDKILSVFNPINYLVKDINVEYTEQREEIKRRIEDYKEKLRQTSYKKFL